MYASVLVGASFFRTVIYHRENLQLSALGMKIRIACSYVIYNKLFRIEKATLEKETVGKVVNLISNDVNRFNSLCQFAHYIWISPIKIIVISCYLDLSLSHSALAGVGIIIVCILLQSKSLKYFNNNL